MFIFFILLNRSYGFGTIFIQKFRQNRRLCFFLIPDFPPDSVRKVGVNDIPLNLLQIIPPSPPLSSQESEPGGEFCSVFPIVSYNHPHVCLKPVINVLSVYSLQTISVIHEYFYRESSTLEKIPAKRLPEKQSFVIMKVSLGSYSSLNDI